VTLTPAERVSFEPHPVHDPQDFADLATLAGTRGVPRLRHRQQRCMTYRRGAPCAERTAYLPQSACPATATTAACACCGPSAPRCVPSAVAARLGAPLTRTFASQYHEHWAATATPLPSRGFRLSYDTNIPRQAGLSGSSAIVTAALSCLEAFFGDVYTLPKPLRPALVLAAESALGITAGLQDRVVQTYEGAVFMDFSAEGMKARGHGEYTPLDPDLLPPLWCVGRSVLKCWTALTCSYSF
jgi:hypothetical protein